MTGLPHRSHTVPETSVKPPRRRGRLAFAASRERGGMFASRAATPDTRSA